MLSFCNIMASYKRALNYYLSKAAAVFSVSKHNVLSLSPVQDLEILLLTVKHLELHIKGV